eukprot:CAMPEP_0181539998 /NCGR_PEP_ID=MMETSP1110-20121109/76665_1 /TAXON_ID=174948 /ORGANISM="Symbiodinium sp., Strain CCMP421" /LENGTH=84 /DNA_ID=CAMNT_0023671637 /DNA_START=334 /DNA_END=588 /DNA_ORIENTATION=+
MSSSTPSSSSLLSASTQKLGRTELALLGCVQEPTESSASVIGPRDVDFTELTELSGLAKRCGRNFETISSFMRLQTAQHSSSSR